MEAFIKDNELVIITEPNAVCFYLPKNVDNYLNHEIDFIVKSNDILVEHTIKNKISSLLSEYKHVNDIHETVCSHQVTFVFQSEFTLYSSLMSRNSLLKTGVKSEG